MINACRAPVVLSGMPSQGLLFFGLTATGPIFSAVTQTPEALVPVTTAGVITAVAVLLLKLSNGLQDHLRTASDHREKEIEQWRQEAKHRSREVEHWRMITDSRQSPDPHTGQ